MPILSFTHVDELKSPLRIPFVQLFPDPPNKGVGCFIKVISELSVVFEPNDIGEFLGHVLLKMVTHEHELLIFPTRRCD
jgi:hypothetical protein